MRLSAPAVDWLTLCPSVLLLVVTAPFLPTCLDLALTLKVHGFPPYFKVQIIFSPKEISVYKEKRTMI